MSEKLIEALKKITSEYNWKIISYSGRSMYGKRCLAITGDNIDQVQLGIELGKTKDIYSPCATQTDSMGRGIVVYWPAIPYEMGNEEE